ncbi:MAG TPA: hypothetical protein IAD51_05480 [Candidatus Limadaptatus stercorigallinarum]|uniref:Lipoprotein n=1 Tax=Candidatus Limadaptatus stercorigallinarum TaxID=2840845 RepID=A0A9D1HS62_9FIRM|nr:hypothetical protein [Candidatus Limadaptatus stercorigallinarum]
MKRALKTSVMIFMLLASLTVAAFAMTACNDGYDTASAYAEAEEKWNLAANKMVTDTGTVNATVGSGESAVPLTAEVSGKRVYIGDEFVFDYTIRLKINSSSSSINLTLDAERDAEGNTTIVIDSAILPLLGVSDISVSFTEEELNDTLPVLNLAAPTFYDAEKISGADGNYSIPGDSSLAWILWQVAPILAYDAGYDILPMIESWLTLGDVTGTLSFADGNFATMTTSQDITAYMPYEDAEFLAYNVEFFPMTLFDFIESGNLIIFNFPNIKTEGIRISGNVSTSATYTVLADDATFESALA